MLRAAATAAVLLSFLAGCGEGDDGGGGAPASGPTSAADLTVTVHPEGPAGPVRVRRIECERLGPGADTRVCRRLAPEQLAPVPRNTACTAVYGGPGVARVTGTLGGERVDERFSLDDGCQIARWERNRRLLGAPGRGP
jgi:hypothetical protein